MTDNIDNLFDKMYKTSDISLASFLMCNSVEMKGTDKENGSRVTFLFDNSDDIEKLANEFYNGARIEARQFANTMRDLKGLIANA